MLLARGDNVGLASAFRSMTDLKKHPTFSEFYRAINRREPFPWQIRLAKKVEHEEVWPSEIGIPTGLGKTACLEIAVWWLSSQADRTPNERTAPTRIWWVVNRRILVDSTAEHANLIAKALHEPESIDRDTSSKEVLTQVASRLRSLWTDASARPLDVITLRGGIASRSPTDPARPTVILCTLPMFGSRLLFRGYGSSRWAVDAAMAGIDSLVLLDEAHLAPHLKALIAALADCNPRARNVLGEGRTRPRVVALTATGDTAAGERFDLDEADLEHPVVIQRLDAKKPLRVKSVKRGSAKALVDMTTALVDKAHAPASVLVYANTPPTARKTFERLLEVMPQAEVLLLTGLAREREAHQVRARILDPIQGMSTARDANAHRRDHLIVVATQTLEVGADIDAEYLVTEGCGVRALTQRMGRLNRLGRFAHARGAYVHVVPPRRDVWPVYGPEPATVLQRLLDARGVDEEATVNLSPRMVAKILGLPLDDPGRAPEVLPDILWEWAKTTTPPEGEAPVEPYFSGISAPGLSVTVIWRTYVPPNGGRLWPRATDREAIDVPLADVRRIFDEEHVCRLGFDGVTTEQVVGTSLRPSDRIVVSTDRGLMDRFGWNPESVVPVVDVSLASHGLPLDSAAIKRLCGVELSQMVDRALGIADDDGEVDETERQAAVSTILDELEDAAAPPGWSDAEWSEFTNSLRPLVIAPRGEVARLPVRRPAREPLNDEFDELSLVLGPVAMELDRHGQAVGERAGQIGKCVGIPDDLLEVVERGATLHDIGKADPRFQRWLDPEGQSVSQRAKSNAPRHRWEAMRVSSGWPRGGRHEDLSARLVRAWLEHTPHWGTQIQRDLLVHLVISHHGKGRPLVRPVRDGASGSVSGVVDGVPVEADADLALTDWDQPSRFWRLHRHLGPWGLALLEAIVIRADHAVSRATTNRRRKPDA